MTKHTPGPWERAPIPGLFVWNPNLSLVVATVGGTTMQEAEANARLIAACPDLLAALEDLERLGADDGRYQKGSPISKAWGAARSAIRKARGES